MSDPTAPQPSGAPVAGWYPDDQGQVRWWDGSGWTEHLQTPPQPTPAPQAEPTPAVAPQSEAEPASQPQPPSSAPPPPSSPSPATGIVPDPFSAAGPVEQPGLASSAPAPAFSQAPDQALAPGYMPTPTPVPETSGSSGGPNYLPWIIALVSVVGLCIAAVLIVSGLGGDEEGKETDVVPSGDVAQVQSGLRTAQTAIESFSLDNNGSYEGATPDALAAIDGTVSQIPLTVSGTATGYVLSAPAGETSFSITRADGGVVTFACTPPGGEGCDASGTWGLDD
ncbi:MAG: DUF2510 domain-containing protein [Solirubrobacterales bacterium]